MSERTTSPKPRGIPQKITAAAAAFALASLAGCSVSPEQQAREEATRQVFADVIAGKTVSKDPFAGNTFTISIKDKYPKIDMNDATVTGTAALYTYQEGEARIRKALGIKNDAPMGSELDLETLAVCDTAAVNGLLTGEQLKAAQDQWDYYQQLGGQKELKKTSVYDINSDAYDAITSLEGTCMRGIGQALKSGADITFVPATND
jgi:hypothetical protein